jgi:hypothetical protein
MEEGVKPDRITEELAPNGYPFPFLSDGHGYSHGRSRLMGVTSVLASCGLIDTERYTEVGRERGSRVHAMIKMYLLGALNEETLDPTLAGYLAAFKAGLAALEFEVSDFEIPMMIPVLGLAGTPDLSGKRKGLPGVVDIKTGGPEAWHRYQTAAYAIIRFPAHPHAVERWGLHLTHWGEFSLQRHADIRDVDDFRSLLRAAQIKEEVCGG